MPSLISLYNVWKLIQLHFITYMEIIIQNPLVIIYTVLIYIFI